ncbi:LlsX family protein [Clostridium sp.]|uniref:LlsX family protein n=1 Tax=Clostridium sp. TaxID=1506 RepID=UPI0029148B49|nr:LlsX family protein [Clostridium sp.]MDU7005646.1 LlsX family protein [Clostridium sp.]MDU7068015.1 LlsX family protein [Clostridium perfringens]
MSYKRLILSVILGMIGGTVLFTLLITINMASIDYDNFKETREFSFVGINYLTVEKSGANVEKTVNSMPIALTSIALGGLSYLGLSIYSKKKEGV